MSGTIGDNVYRASGVIAAAAAGGGAVDWQTGAIKTSGFTPTAGEGYFVNTTSGAITVTLAAGVIGEMVGLSDYAQTWATNAVTVTPNGTDKIGGANDNATLNTEGQSVVIIYVDSTRGWIDVTDSTSAIAGESFMVASGGTPSCGTTCGDYKIHTFTGPGNFCVSAISSSAPLNVVDYLVVAGGAGGGGAGGFRASSSTFTNAGPSSPLTTPAACSAALPVAVACYPVAVGGGGAGGAASPTCTGLPGANGNNSVFTGTTTITSTAGGAGNTRRAPQTAPNPGGSGGGGGAGGPGGSHGCAYCGGAGNTPPTTPSQGTPGGIGDSTSPNPLGGYGGGGGGGAIVAGTQAEDGVPQDERCIGGAGGGFPGSVFGCNGEVCGSNRYFSGGGGGQRCGPVTTSGLIPGGVGGGGLGALRSAPGGNEPVPTRNGTVNTGGGGGGTGGVNYGVGGAGGSGIVVIRYKYQ